MSRVSAPRRAPPRGSRRRPRGAWPAALTWAGVAAVLLLGVFLAHPLLEGYRLPLGPDGPVYVWWARFVEVEGLDAVRRPGAPALILTLTTLLGVDTLRAVAVLEPVLAMAVGLAGGALAEAALGPDPARFAVTTLLVGTFAGLLAAGWLANLVLAALFLTALAGFALAERSWRPVGLAAACLAAGGVAHSLFLAVALTVVAGSVVLLVPRALQSMRRGTSAVDTAALRLSAGAAAGGGGALLSFALLSGGAAGPGDTSQDQVFRRVGMRETLTLRYRERLLADGQRVAVPAVAAIAAAWPGTLHGVESDRRSFALAVAAAWVAVTIVGVGVLWTTGVAPAGRFLTFAYVLPLAAAAAAASAMRWGGWLRVAAAAAAAIVAASSLWGWYRQTPFVSERELARVESVAPVLERLPEGTPIVVAVDTEEFAAAFHIARFGNVIRAAIPAERIADTYLVVGGPEEVLAGRPGTRSEDPEYRAIASAYLERARAVLAEAAILVLAPFNPGYDEAREIGELVAPEAMLLRSPVEIGPPPSPAGSGDRGLSAVAWIAWSVLASVVLTLLGLGWTTWGLREAGLLAALAAAPAAGLGALILGGLAADRLALPAALGGAALAGALALGGYALAARHGTVEPAEQAGA